MSNITITATRTAYADKSLVGLSLPIQGNAVEGFSITAPDGTKHNLIHYSFKKEA